MTTLDSLIGSGLIAADVPLGPFTTYKSGGRPGIWQRCRTPVHWTT